MRKLSFEENLRHRLRDVPRFRYREERTHTEGLLMLAIGAVAGLAAGAILTQQYGGLGALASRLRERFGAELDEEEYGGEDFDEYDTDDDLTPLEELEERVLETYHNDPILSERAIDIGAIDDGIIELTGWVYAAEEAEHAVTVARGTPGVETVVNRLTVRAEEDKLDDSATRYEAGDDRFTESHWEGQGVGIGRRRQGKSSDPGRHEDPRVELEDRWMNEQEAYRAAADDVQGVAERRTRGSAKGTRADGPSDVPKADRVAQPGEGIPPADAQQ